MLMIFLSLCVAYFLLFLISIFTKDNSLVDTFWGIGFMMIALLSYRTSEYLSGPTLLTSLICLWGLRIASHIGIRKLKYPSEDARYAQWRKEWGNGWYFYVRSFLQVYLFQMILMCMIAVPIFVTNLSDNVWNTPYYTIFGTLIAISGIIIETISDRQLSRFIKIKKPGQIFMSGLYKYSRHPNYFGESIFWLGISLISLPYSLFGIIGWITITYLLVFVSGIPLQESRYIGRPEWEQYKMKTSAFIPWFQKNI